MTMNLKEAFRYQNFLDRKISIITCYLLDTKNVMITKQEHLRKKANSEADNEIIENVTEREIEKPVNVLIRFTTSLLAEKEKLCFAIDKAKNNCGINIDSSIAMNKCKQSVARTFANMSNIKATDKIVSGKGYRFNAEGNQVPYTYDIKEVSIIDFDRNMVKYESKRLNMETDDVSNKIDQIMVSTIVNYVPLYDVNDSLDDMIEIFATFATKVDITK